MNNWAEFPIEPQYGWVCPICGRVMSPITPYCPCNGQGVKTVTTTGTGLDWMHHETITKADTKMIEEENRNE